NERGLHPLRIRAQRRIADRGVSTTERGGEPVHMVDIFSGEASVEIRLDPLIEDFRAQEVSDVHPDRLLGWHPPEPLEDRIDPSIAVISSDDGDSIRGALEHLLGQILRPLALGDVHHGHEYAVESSGRRWEREGEED